MKGTYGNIMIEKEQNPKDDPKRERNANPPPIQIPKSYQPLSSSSRCESPTHRKSLRIRMIKAAPIGACRRGYESKGHPVIGKEPSNVAMEIRGGRERLEENRSDEHEEG